ncbi:MAG: tetratricopeptide repeat protein [Elusimicrobia bacterium]|jgi:TolA-binding protein|nr:tetratricopeptide repeat protein [Elusimicrobiota bacterium]
MIYIIIIIVGVALAVITGKFLKEHKIKQRQLKIKDKIKKNKPINSEGEVRFYEEFIKRCQKGKHDRLCALARYALFNFYKEKANYTIENIKKAVKIGELMKKDYKDRRFHNDLLFMLGNLYCFNLNDFEKALDTYNYLLEVSPATKWKDVCRDRINLIRDNIANRVVLVKYVTAEKHFENLEFDEAERYLKIVIKNNRGMKIAGNAFYFLGDIYYYKYNDLEEAYKYYSDVFSAYPSHPLNRNALYKSGEILRKLNNWDEAVKVYKKYIENFKDTPYVEDAYFFLGDCYYNLGRLKQAKNSFSLILGDYPDSKWTEVIYHKIQEINSKLKKLY